MRDHVCGDLEAPEARCDDLMLSALNLAWSLLGSIPGLGKTFFSHSSSLHLTGKTGTSEALGKLGRGERVTWDG